MINYDILFAVIFYGLIVIFFLKYRERFEVQGKIFVMYRTKLGLRLMDYLSKKIPTLLKIFSFMGVIIGFAGMAYITYFIVRYTLKFIFIPGTAPPLAPVLPGVSIPGAPPLSFWHWIIAILILAIVHEFCHGVVARLHNIKVKSSGFAFLGPILAAFVEPDEAQVIKKPKRHQLEMFAAGPFSNIVLAFIFLLILTLIVTPYVNENAHLQGLKVIDFKEDFTSSNIQKGDTIFSVNNINLINKRFSDFSDEVKNNVNKEVILKLKDINNNIKTTNIKIIPSKDNPEEGTLGIYVKGIYDIKGKALIWFLLLTIWLFIANLGVGLFNLLPLGPVDGGRMFSTAVSYFIKSEKKARKLTNIVSFVLLALIIINLLPYLYKLLLFIIKPFL